MQSEHGDAQREESGCQERVADGKDQNAGLDRRGRELTAGIKSRKRQGGDGSKTGVLDGAAFRRWFSRVARRH